jgi:plastocyanin
MSRSRFLLMMMMLSLPGLVRADDAPLVVQKDKRFDRDSVEIVRNGFVTFTNQDQVRHNIALRTPDGENRTGIVQAPGDTNRISFDQAGLFQVHCLIHPQMRMSVVAK